MSDTNERKIPEEANELLDKIPFFKFPPEIRRVIYATNVIESVNASIRHITNNRALFPNDDSVFKLLYLALTNASKK